MNSTFKELDAVGVKELEILEPFIKEMTPREFNALELGRNAFCSGLPADATYDKNMAHIIEESNAGNLNTTQIIVAWSIGWVKESLLPHGPEADPYSEYYKGFDHTWNGKEWIKKGK